jgi:hypothetical protein
MGFLTVIVITKNNCNLRIHMSDITSNIRKNLRSKTSEESINQATIKEVICKGDTFEIVIQTKSETYLDTFKTNVVAWFTKIFDDYLADAKKYFRNIQEDEVTVALQEETPLQLLKKAQQQEVAALTRQLQSVQLLELMQLKESHVQQMSEFIAELTQKHAAQRTALSDN